MSNYATHLPILDSVVKAGDHAVEFGCGKFSTPFLLGRCAAVMSIEQTAPEWVGAVNELTGAPSNWTPVIALSSSFMAVDYPPRIDVAFVDGLPATRWACVLLMMQLRVPTIVAHDTEKPYHWEKVRSEKYVAEIHKELTPWTTVWRLLPPAVS